MFYKDNIYSDGLLISATGNQYFGIDPQKRDDSLFRAMSGANNSLRMTANGLAFQQGSSSWYRLNPLALIVRLTYSNGNWSASALYNPRGITPSASHISTGRVTLTHNLNIASAKYSVKATGNTINQTCFTSAYDRQASSCKIEIMSGGSN